MRDTTTEEQIVEAVRVYNVACTEATKKMTDSAEKKEEIARFNLLKLMLGFSPSKHQMEATSL